MVGRVPVTEVPTDHLEEELADRLSRSAPTAPPCGELLKYLAVLSLEKPGTFPDALRLASNLDDYERIVEGTYEYGQSFLRRHGADEELIEALEGYMDFEKFGSDAMEEDGVRGTEFGLIRRCSQLLEDETQVMQMGGM